MPVGATQQIYLAHLGTPAPRLGSKAADLDAVVWLEENLIYEDLGIIVWQTSTSQSVEELAFGFDLAIDLDPGETVTCTFTNQQSGFCSAPAAPVRPQGAPKKRNTAYLKGCGDRILRTKRSNGVDFWPGSKWQLKKKRRRPAALWRP